ncbi:MAG: HAD hydrolase-like protein, partial [Pygmaiobacter sp.]
MANYNCLMIDLDGTLLDFDATEDEALKKTFAEFNFPLTEENIAEYKQINSELWAALEQGKVNKDAVLVGRWKKFLAHLGRLGSAAKINDFYLAQLAEGAQAIPGALEFLADIEEYVTIAIITNGAEK